MTLCTWCGQESQSNVICDWCKRPLPLQTAAASASSPRGARSDLDFLREESEDRPPYMVIALAGVGLVAFATLMFFMIRSQAAPAVTPVATNRAPTSNSSPGVFRDLPTSRTAGPVFRTVNLEEGRATLVARTPSGRPRGPEPATNTNFPVGVDFPSLVKISNAQVTMVSVPGGKQVLGKVDIVNQSERNVLDFRLELVWGPNTYVVVPMTGSARSLRPMDQRALPVGGRLGMQVASQVIANSPDGAPHSIRLLCWLDGKPNNSLDEYPIR